MSPNCEKFLFDVKRSIRYHDRRKSFFELMHRLTAFLTILMAGSVIFQAGIDGKPSIWLITISIIAALIAASDMVIGYAEMADLHRSLKNKFSSLEITVISDTKFDTNYSKHVAQRLKIEQNEPPVYRALDKLCYNEVLIAEGYDKCDLFEVSCMEVLTRHIFHWA